MCNQSILDKLNILYPADGKVKKNVFYLKNTEAHKNIILKTVLKGKNKTEIIMPKKTHEC